MRCLITGGAGSIGGHLTRALLSKGFSVRVLDKEIGALNSIKNENLELIKGDIKDPLIVKKAVEGTDFIVHLAWSFSDDPHVVFGEDIEGHIHLLDGASSMDIKGFIYTSTAVVYGKATIHPVTEGHPCLIQDARKPLYGLAKYTAEQLCLMYYKKYRLPITIFRFWWAFGDTIGGSHLRDLIKKAINNEPIYVVKGAGGTFLTMDDFVKAVNLSLMRPASHGNIYNIGSLFITWHEIIETIIRLTSSRSTVNLVPSHLWTGPAFLNEAWDLDCTKAEKELTFKPLYPPDEVMSKLTMALENTIRSM